MSRIVGRSIVDHCTPGQYQRVSTSTTNVHAAAEVLSVARSALERAGATTAHASMQATQLVEAELRGHPSHGIRRIPVLVGRLANGLISTGKTPRLTWLGSGALQVDGGYGFGPVSAHAALDALLPRAVQTGIAAATISHSHHIGMLSPYVERMVEADCIGVILTISEGLVHPWGGVGALVGTNPIGIGVPSAQGPLILDMSTAAVSMGKVLDYAARGEPLPRGWAVDANGEPTTDASAVSAGAISPFGGAKGYALAIALEALVSLLARSSYGADVKGTLDTEHPTTKGDLFIAISTKMFGATSNDADLAAYLNLIRASGYKGATVSVPGDRARAERAKRVANGIPIDRELWQKVQALATSTPRKE